LNTFLNCSVIEKADSDDRLSREIVKLLYVRTCFENWKKALACIEFPYFLTIAKFKQPGTVFYSISELSFFPFDWSAQPFFALYWKLIVELRFLAARTHGAPGVNKISGISSEFAQWIWDRHWTYPFFEDIISYPLSRPKKWYNIISYITAKKRIGYYILYPYLQKFHKITLF
jgi:hypothetical protein